MDPISLSLQLGRIALALTKKARVVWQAIEVTASNNAQVSPHIRSWLEDWVKTPEYNSLLLDLQTGERLVVDSELIESFVKVTNLSDASSAPAIAKTILQDFLFVLDKFILGSSEAARLDRRAENRAQAQTEEIVNKVSTWVGQQIKSQQAIAASDGVGRRSDEEQGYHDRLDQAKGLIDFGHIAAARSIISNLQSDLAAQSHTNHLRFRIHTNLGACTLYDGSYEDAESEFKAALVCEPNSLRGYSNLARIAILHDEFDKALDLSRKAMDLMSPPVDTDVLTVRILSLSAADKGGEIAELVSDYAETETDPGCLLARADHSYSIGAHDSAEAIAKQIRGHPQTNAVAAELLGRAIFGPIRERLSSTGAVPWRLDEATTRRLNEAEEHFSAAISITQKTDYRQLLVAAYTNRASCRHCLRRYVDAEEDCRAALSIDPSCNVARRELASIYLLGARYDRVAETLEALVAGADDPEVKTTLAVAYQELARFKGCRRIACTQLESAPARRSGYGC